MADWQKLDIGIVNVDEYKATVDIADTTLAPLTTALKTSSSILKLVAAVVYGLPPALEQVVGAAVDTIEQMVLDLLSYNAALAVHTNLKWNPNWKWRKSDTDPPKVVDFVNDDAIPITGTGTTGWLLDIAYSACDSSNPFRPLSDDDTAVQGVIILKGVPEDGDIQSLKNICDVFTDFYSYKSWFGVRESLEEATEEAKAVWRLGAVAVEEIVAVVNRPIEETLTSVATGSFVAQGPSGANAAGSSFFSDAGGYFDSRVHIGDILKLQGEDALYRVMSIPDIFTIGLDHPIVRYHGDPDWVDWKIYRGGFFAALETFPDELREFLPKAGATPIWLSVPVASLIPAVGNLLSSMQNVGNSMRVGISQADALGKLITVLEKKVQLIEAAINELNELLVTLASVLEFFDDTYLIVINIDEGGMARFVNEAIGGGNLPSFGDRGVVVGMVAVATSDDPRNQMERFFELVGIKFSDYADDVTVADQARQATWDKYFP